MYAKEKCNNVIQPDLPPCQKLNKCLEKSLDTSTDIGHRFIPAVNVINRSMDYKLSKELNQPSVTLKGEIMKTTSNQAYQWTYDENDRNKFVRIPVSKLHYISRYGENMRKNPPKPFRIPKSDYQENYQYVSVLPPNSNCVNMRPDVICKVVSLDKDQRPILTAESEGYSKLIDHYRTTSQLAHHGFDRNDIEKYISKSFGDCFQLPPRVKPVYDTLVFKTKYLEKVLPKGVRHVPHSGMESEMKGNYRMPMNEVSHSYVMDRPSGLPPVTSASVADVLSVPFMYHSEYNQIGRSLLACTLR